MGRKKEYSGHMIRIRLRRVGAKRQPSYRIVVADSRSPRDGRFIEKIGFYNPRTEPATMQLDEARALYWLSNGAQPSDAVEHILTRLGTTGRYQRLRSGEDISALIAEAEAEAQARPLNLKTRRDSQPVVEEAPPAKKGRGKAKAKPAEETPVTAEPEAEVEEVPATEAEAE